MLVAIASRQNAYAELVASTVKVYIKVMQRDNRGPHILVRVGGGFMHID